MSVIDLPGTEGINLCRRCGAILVSGECPQCSIKAQAEKMAEAIDEDTKNEKARAKGQRLDVYKALEEQVKMFKTRQRQIKKILSQFDRALREAQETDDIFVVERIAKAMTMLDKSLHTVGANLPKVAKEMLAFQTARSRLVSEMSVDEQMAQINRWFERLPGPRQLILLEALTQSYNRAKERRVAAKALRRQKRENAS